MVVANKKLLFIKCSLDASFSVRSVTAACTFSSRQEILWDLSTGYR